MNQKLVQISEKFGNLEKDCSKYLDKIKDLNQIQEEIDQFNDLKEKLSAESIQCSEKINFLNNLKFSIQK